MHFIILFTLALFYFVLTTLFIKFIIFTKSIEGFLFWVITLIMNISLSINIKTKDDKFIQLKAFIISAFSNFFIIGTILFLSTKPFRIISNSSILNNYLAVMVEVSVTGNWLLPCLIITITKAINYSSKKSHPPPKNNLK